MSKKLNEIIIERARQGSLAWTVQTEQDRKNLCEFVKMFALDCLHDLDFSKELFKEED